MSTAYGDATLARVHERLEGELRRVREEIRRYPAPIPACDAQFNYLLESREALSTTLARLEQLASGGVSSDTRAAGSPIDALLDASVNLDDAMRSEIRAIVENEIRKAEVGR